MSAASPVPGGPEIAPDFLDRDLAADLTTTALAMARRLAAGATMWCVAPGREPRAHHLAAKFTHQRFPGERLPPRGDAPHHRARRKPPRHGQGGRGKVRGQVAVQEIRRYFRPTWDRVCRGHESIPQERITPSVTSASDSLILVSAYPICEMT